MTEHREHEPRPLGEPARERPCPSSEAGWPPWADTPAKRARNAASRQAPAGRHPRGRVLLSLRLGSHRLTLRTTRPARSPQDGAERLQAAYRAWATRL